MELSAWGKVTEALAVTLRQLTQVSGNAYNPITLLNHLREKYRQFKGYNQHDAHELLRQLLDSVKMEDARVSFSSFLVEKYRARIHEFHFTEVPESHRQILRRFEEPCRSR